MKQCNKCKQDKSLNSFYKNVRMKDGLNTFCIDCHKLDNVARKLVNRRDSAFKEKELQYKKLYRERTISQRASYMKAWRQQNEQHVLQYDKNYRKDNKHKSNYLCQLRKISIMQRTPRWLSENDLWMIEEAYKLASLRTKLFGFSWHVDHVIPLRGRLVSGLHSPYNLQIIPASLNQRKSNSYGV